MNTLFEKDSLTLREAGVPLYKPEHLKEYYEKRGKEKYQKMVSFFKMMNSKRPVSIVNLITNQG